jgi:hypothetical protein
VALKLRKLTIPLLPRLTAWESAQETGTAPSYNDLLRENQELKLALSHANPSLSHSHHLRPLEEWYTWEKLVFTDLQPSATGMELSWPDIPLPSRELSLRLLCHDRLWNSWVHYGVQYPQFEDEHAAFWDNLEAGTALTEIDPFWLAIYFAILSTALLSIGKEDLSDVNLPQGTFS